MHVQAHPPIEVPEGIGIIVKISSSFSLSLFKVIDCRKFILFILENNLNRDSWLIFKWSKEFSWNSKLPIYASSIT